MSSVITKVANCRDESDEDAEGCQLLVLKENYRKDILPDSDLLETLLM